MKPLPSLCLIALLFICKANPVWGKNARPNILFFLADDCSYLDLDLYGGPAKTPHINKLAKSGMTFKRCYQAAAMCSPTRHCLYTGLYPVRSGAYPNHARAYENVRSIAHYLSESGYQVALAGKTHIEPKQVFPFEYLKEFADPIDQDVKEVNGWRYPLIYKLLKESAVSGKPTCLFLCSNEPHGPYTKGDPKPYRDVSLSPQQLEHHRDSYAKYLAEITYFDGQVGEVMRMLDSLNLRENTLVFVASEQGSSYPFGKWTCYEVGVASGLVVSWPGEIKPGSKTDAIVEYVDVVPTMLEVAGAEVPESLDGRSFLPVLKGTENRHKKYAYSLQTTVGVNGAKQPYGIRSVVNEKFRLVLNLFPENEFSIPTSRRLTEETSAMGDSEKLFARRFAKRPKWELFEVAKDPYCLNNLAADTKYDSQRNLLSNALEEWMLSQNDQGRQTELAAEGRQAEWKQVQYRQRDREKARLKAE
jgi:N-sulfoglucosamine sulfohydrolase